MMDALPLYDARQAGLKEGIAIGEKQKDMAMRLTAKNLLKMNLGTVEQIATATQLSVDEVLKIKQEI